jgi:hypothetical protein
MVGGRQQDVERQAYEQAYLTRPEFQGGQVELQHNSECLRRTKLFV